MEAIFYVGTAAAICTTSAFIPQIIKISKQGGKDLSYSMMFLYLAGAILWLVYGLLLHAGAVIWANGITFAVLLVALVLKVTHPGRG